MLQYQLQILFGQKHRHALLLEQPQLRGLPRRRGAQRGADGVREVRCRNGENGRRMRRLPQAAPMLGT